MQRGVDLDTLPKTTFLISPPLKTRNRNGTLRWKWEMDRLPSSANLIRSSIIKLLSFDRPKSVPEIHDEIVYDVGATSIRTIHRHVRQLMTDRVIRCVSNEDTYGYVKVGSRRRPKKRSISVTK